MGRLIYGRDLRVEIDDRVLAHLQAVFTNKLRRGEPFWFSWKDEHAVEARREAVWVHPRATLLIRYYGARQPTLNRAWVDALLQTANSAGGLHIVPEP